MQLVSLIFLFSGLYCISLLFFCYFLTWKLRSFIWNLCFADIVLNTKSCPYKNCFRCLPQNLICWTFILIKFKNFLDFLLNFFFDTWLFLEVCYFHLFGKSPYLSGNWFIIGFHYNQSTYFITQIIYIYWD